LALRDAEGIGTEKAATGGAAVADCGVRSAACRLPLAAGGKGVGRVFILNTFLRGAMARGGRKGWESMHFAYFARGGSERL